MGSGLGRQPEIELKATLLLVLLTTLPKLVPQEDVNFQFHSHDGGLELKSEVILKHAHLPPY